LAWALLMLAAIVTASLGLWGICRQFGLMGAPKNDTMVKERMTLVDGSSPNQMTRGDLGQETVIEWEEEF